MLYLLLLLASVSFASPCKVENFFGDRERGWFWRNVCLEEEKKEEKKPKKKEEKVVVIPWSRLKDMTAKEIRELMTNTLEVAVTNPTYENVREYLRLQKWVLERSRKFQEVASLVNMTDPELSSYVGKIPSSKVAKDVYMSETQERMRKKLDEYRDRAGLLVAVSERCGYCKAFKRMAKLFFVPNTGWKIKYIDVDEYPAFAYRMQVSSVPDIFLAVMGQEPFVIRIGTGYLTETELIERVYRGIQIYEQGGLGHVQKAGAW